MRRPAERDEHGPAPDTGETESAIQEYAQEFARQRTERTVDEPKEDVVACLSMVAEKSTPATQPCDASFAAEAIP